MHASTLVAICIASLASASHPPHAFSTSGTGFIPPSNGIARSHATPPDLIPSIPRQEAHVVSPARHRMNPAMRALASKFETPDAHADVVEPKKPVVVARPGISVTPGRGRGVSTRPDPATAGTTQREAVGVSAQPAPRFQSPAQESTKPRVHTAGAQQRHIHDPRPLPTPTTNAHSRPISDTPPARPPRAVAMHEIGIAHRKLEVPKQSIPVPSGPVDHMISTPPLPLTSSSDQDARRVSIDGPMPVGRRPEMAPNVAFSPVLAMDHSPPVADPKDYLKPVEIKPEPVQIIPERPSTPPAERKRRFWGLFSRRDKKRESPPVVAPPPEPQGRAPHLDRLIVTDRIPDYGASTAFGPDVPVEFLSAEARAYVQKYGKPGAEFLQIALNGDPRGKDPVSIRRPSDPPLLKPLSPAMASPHSPMLDRDAQYSPYEELRLANADERIKYRYKFYTRDYNDFKTIHPHCKNVDPQWPLRFVCYSEEAPLVLDMAQMTALEKVLSAYYKHTHVGVGVLDHPDQVDINSKIRVIWGDRLYSGAEYFTVNIGDGCAYRDERLYLVNANTAKICWTMVVMNKQKIGSV